MTQERKLTDEQQAIIHSTGDIRINAVAGSGKTTTLIEYAASRPTGSKILYLAFNKSVKLEAQRKFAAKNLTNVKVETAHSLAYKHIFRSNHYSLKSSGYKMHEIVELLDLRGNGEKHTEYIIANHISKFISYFCNSDKAKVQELNYLDTVNDPNAQSFVHSFYKYIEDGTRLFLSKMDKGEIEITHDFYLKKFQLSRPVLPYDYILFDEGQDASGAMLSVFLHQKAVKVIVGDTHQQIYGWRYAVNSLEKTDFQTFHLSASFRFQQPIANLANELLKWKKHLKKYTPVLIRGKGSSTAEKSKATIARTNLGLLLSAIDFITDNPKIKHLYFEGNINSYTYADDGASLYDVLSLYNNNHDRVRDKLIKSMHDLDDLEDYVEKTEDVQLGMMAGIVKEYGNEIPAILKRLKDLHTGDDSRDNAEMIFSTVHRAKGMEYDVVYLAGDFIKEADLERAKNGQQKENVDTSKLNEEINLLYVAVTRTKNILHVPEALLPENFPSSALIKVVKTEDKRQENAFTDNKTKRSGAGNIKQIKEKAYTVAKQREISRDAYKPWTSDQDEELRYLYESDNPISAIADHFGRTKGAIISRLKKLNYFTE
ncbi:MAG: DNA helicase [Sphingobacteriales bacterium SCN 48-20]|uniref:UvrD-helicase domain-containing protein n=1 Tax=Terrimonas ferruginea TaxID=249 RepID=UPI00086EC15D|nr:UvrD-helicase domain-containing protein [Terrimonas ferruginea]MBN8784410.1 ATP-dependent helicase [Terrimonas ferruginea]ODT91528.1 MAG: DNA helicase [Sphingobacteriales bacterium SCN 48-20]OJW45835.1 MAG: DNA helicase [Sphingobacteriales bacterium 48-107]